jgi:hypothetical protein
MYNSDERRLQSFGVNETTTKINHWPLQNLGIASTVNGGLNTFSSLSRNPCAVW